MRISFRPEGEEWDGTVTVDVKPAKERTEMAMRMNQVEDDSKKAEFMIELVQSSIVSVDLRHVATGIQVRDVEDLAASSEGFALMTGVIGGYLINGVPLALRAGLESRTMPVAPAVGSSVQASL